MVLIFIPVNYATAARKNEVHVFSSINLSQQFHLMSAETYGLFVYVQVIPGFLHYTRVHAMGISTALLADIYINF